MVWGILAMMAFYLTDTWFVARLGSAALAAMSFSFPVVTVLMSVGIGLMAGTSSVLARAIGEGDQARVQRLTTDALVFAVLLSLALSALGLATIDPLFRLLGAPRELLPAIGDYMRVWYAGLVCLLVPMVGLGAIRATGDSRLQSRTMIAAALLNLVLDPLLIFGLAGLPRLELTGAALATVIARTMTLAIGFWAVHWKFAMLSFTPPSATQLWRSWKRVLHIALPATGSNVIIPLATGVVIAILARFGPDTVAGFGAAARIEAVVLVPFYALSAVIGPFVGQNLGAGRPQRVAQAVRLCRNFCLGAGVTMALALALFGAPLMGLFSNQPEVIASGTTYLRIVPISYAGAGVVMILNAAYNGLGRPLPAVAVSVGRMLVLYIPGALAGAALFGIEGVFGSACAANLIAAAATLWWFPRVIARPQPNRE